MRKGVDNVQLWPCSSHVTACRQAADLDDVSKVTVGSQLQALPLRPVLDGCETLAQRGAPVVAAQATAVGLGAHQLVEEPRAGKVKELGEELDGKSRIDPAAAQQGHGVHQCVQDHLCKGRRHRLSCETAYYLLLQFSVCSSTYANWQGPIPLRVD